MIISSLFWNAQNMQEEYMMKNKEENIALYTNVQSHSYNRDMRRTWSGIDYFSRAVLKHHDVS
jgi:hypothetical protein